MPISTPYPIHKHFQKKFSYPIQSPNRSPYCRSVRIGDRIERMKWPSLPGPEKIKILPQLRSHTNRSLIRFCSQYSTIIFVLILPLLFLVLSPSFGRKFLGKKPESCSHSLFFILFCFCKIQNHLCVSFPLLRGSVAYLPVTITCCGNPVHSTKPFTSESVTNKNSRHFEKYTFPTLVQSITGIPTLFAYGKCEANQQNSPHA